MLAGFGVAAVLIVAALFQEPLLALARWLVRRGGRVVAASARGALAGVGKVAERGQRLTGTLVRGARGMRQRVTVDGRSRRAEPTPHGSAATAERPAASAASPLPAPPPPDEWPPIDPAEPLPAPTRTHRRQSRDDIFVDRRTYLPASSVAVAEKAREFLEQRGGIASASALAQHLDGHFGRGQGVVLLEALRNRGAVELRRDPLAPTRIEVRIPAHGGGGTGSGSRSP
jgi:hypothetical protein